MRLVCHLLLVALAAADVLGLHLGPRLVQQRDMEKQDLSKEELIKMLEVVTKVPCSLLCQY